MKVLSDYLKRTGCSQAAFGRRVGMSRSQISRLLSGERRLTLRSIQAVSAETGIPVKKLLDATNDTGGAK